MATALAITQRRVAPDGRELGLAVDEGKKKLFLIVPVQRDKVRLAVLRRLRELTPMEQAAGLEGFFTITGVEQVGEELLLAINFDQALWDSWSEQRDRRITPEETVLLLNRCLQLLLACRQQGIPWFGFHPTDVVWSASAGPVLLDPRLGLILDDVMPAEPRRDFCLPPEVLQGQAWTESSALYTIGLTVYTLLGGIFPYQTGMPPMRRRVCSGGTPGYSLCGARDWCSLGPLAGGLIEKGAGGTTHFGTGPGEVGRGNAPRCGS